MKIICLGGGPAGLYFAISMKLRDPAHQVTVLERNRANDTFGWGVVLSDDALGRMQANDPTSTQAIRDAFAYWDDIAVVKDGVRTVSGGHGFAGIGRRQMLVILQARARDLGVELRFETEFRSAEEYRQDYDLVVAADGINSLVRKEYEAVFQPDIDLRRCRFVWLGTRQKFDGAFTFIFEKTPQGWIWAHVYQFDADTATFIVECLPETWDALGFAAMSKEETRSPPATSIFARHLGGHELMSNAAHLRGSAVWMQFPRVICGTLVSRKRRADGRFAAATGHFSIGSGSRLAFDSADCAGRLSAFSEPTHGGGVPERYQDERRVEVLRLQSAARNSAGVVRRGRTLPGHAALAIRLFAADPLPADCSHENLRLRDPVWLAEGRGLVSGSGGRQPLGAKPMFAPFTPAGHDAEEPHRGVAHGAVQVPSMARPADWHFVHYAERAKGGAGLVYDRNDLRFGPMAASPPVARAFTRPRPRGGWKRLVDFIHAETDAKICCQIGHAGARARPSSVGRRATPPCLRGNWPLMAPSALALVGLRGTRSPRRWTAPIWTR